MKYGKFIAKFAVLFFVLVVLDFVIGKGLERLYSSQKSGFDYRTGYAINQTKSGLLIFGSSRATRNYNPKYLTDNYNYTSYDVGRRGEGVFYDYAILRAVRARYRPKSIILDIRSEDFETSLDKYNGISTLLPYYKSHPEIKDVITLISPHEKYKMLSDIYPYNSLIFKIIISNFDFNKDRQPEYNGYLPMESRDTNLLREDILLINKQNSEKKTIDTVKVAFFEKFIKCCKESNINLLIIASPYPSGYHRYKGALDIVDSVCRRQGIKYMDYTYIKGFSDNKDNFYDTNHLRAGGAITFSKIISKELLNLGY